MIRRRLISAVVTMALTVVLPGLMLPSAKAQDTNPSVLPNGSQYYGKYHGEWAAEWWKWVVSIPLDRNPLVDETGEFAGEGQSGPVWFLVGILGWSPIPLPVVRTCTVPAGKALFFPIVNQAWFGFPEDPPEQKDEEWIRALLASIMDTAENLSCEIDGQPVHNLGRYRVVSPVFWVPGRRAPLWADLGYARKYYAPNMDDGIYLMLPPMCKGEEHTIHFQGEMGDLVLDVTYNLTVVGPCRGHK